MRNSSSLDWLRFMHTPNDYRVSLFFIILFSIKYILINVFPSNGHTPPDEKQYFFDLGLNK